MFNKLWKTDYRFVKTIGKPRKDNLNKYLINDLNTINYYLTMDKNDSIKVQ